MTTLHLESGLTRSLATINMADEGVAGKGKERKGLGLRERGVSFLKSGFTPAWVYFGKGHICMFWKLIHLGYLISTDSYRISPLENFM